MSSKGSGGRGLLVRFSKNLGYMSLLKGVDSLAPLIVTPYLVHVVGLDNFGHIAASLALGVIFSTLIQFGFNLTGVRDVAASRGSSESLRHAFSYIYISQSILFIVLFSVFFTGVIFFVKEAENRFLYQTALLSGAVQGFLPIWYFQGMERIRAVALLKGVSKLLYLLFIYVLITVPDEYYLVNVIQFGSGLFVLVAALYVVVWHDRIGFNWKLSGVLVFASKSFDAFLVQFLPNLYNNFTMILLNGVGLPAAAGALKIAMVFGDGLSTLSRIVSFVFMPHVAKNPQHHGIFAKYLSAVSAALVLVGVLVAQYAVELLFPAAQGAVVSATQWVLLSTFFLTVSMIYGQNLLIVRGHDQLARNCYLSVSVVFFCLALLLVPYAHLAGALGVIVGARASVALCLYVKSRRLIRDLS